MVRLVVDAQAAEGSLDLVPHKFFQKVKRKYWRPDATGNLPAQSACWLYCWGKTGRGSPKAARAARDAFDLILDLSFAEFDARVPHEWARWARYAKSNIESELSSHLRETLVEGIEIAFARSQGFASSQQVRKAVEVYAMQKAEKYYQDRGFTVHDQSSIRPYDLKCVHSEQELFVEVKGTQSTGEKIILTPNEVEFAKQNMSAMVLFVVSSVVVNEHEDGVDVTGGRIRIIQPWNVEQGDLIPMSFSYVLPDSSATIVDT